MSKYWHATLSTAHIMSMSSTKRPRIDWIIVSNAVQLVMVREGLLVLSDSRISKDDVCAAIEYLCVE